MVRDSAPAILVPQNSTVCKDPFIFRTPAFLQCLESSSKARSREGSRYYFHFCVLSCAGPPGIQLHPPKKAKPEGCPDVQRVPESPPALW
jgi:hypothetical protein